MQLERENEMAIFFPPAPRAVSRKPWTGGCALWFVRLFILPHTIAFIVMALSVPARLYVARYGTEVSGVIDQRDITVSRKGNNRYEISYHYVLNGRRYDERTSVGEGDYNLLQVGDQFTGRASAIGGHALLIGPDWQHEGTLGLALVTLFMGAILSVFIYGVWVLPLRHRWIAMIGQPACGIITGQREKKGKGSTYIVYYTFVMPDGLTCDGKYNVSSFDYLSAVEGSPVTVLFDLRRPRRNLPYEYCEFVIKSR